MITLLLKRLLTSRYLRTTRLLTLFFALLIFLLHGIFFPLSPPAIAFPPRAKASAAQLLPQIKSVYIASVQYNSEGILREHWVPSLVQLVGELRAVGIKVYVSVYENDSTDNSKEVLAGLGERLAGMGVGNTVRLVEETRAAAIGRFLASSAGGWLETLYGRELRRIVYLAHVRNRALKPLGDLNRAGVWFDRVLFLNDVIFSVGFRDSRNGVFSNQLILSNRGRRCDNAVKHQKWQLFGGVRLRFHESSVESR